MRFFKMQACRYEPHKIAVVIWMGLVDARVPSLIVSPLLVTVIVSVVVSINSLNSRWRSHALTEAQHEHPDNGVSTQHPSNKLSSHHLRENI